MKRVKHGTKEGYLAEGYLAEGSVTRDELVEIQDDPRRRGESLFGIGFGREIGIGREQCVDLRRFGGRG